MSGFPPEDLCKCHLFASTPDGGQELPKGQVLASRATLLPRQTAASGACHKAKISRNNAITTQKFNPRAKQDGWWRDGQREGAEPEPLHQGAQETPESVPKQARGRWTAGTHISWKKLQIHLPVIHRLLNQTQAGADSRVKGCPTTARGLCLPAQSCQGKSLLAPSPEAQEGSCLPSPSQKAAHEEGARARTVLLFFCSPHLSLRAENQPQSTQPPGPPDPRDSPKARGNTEVPAPHRPGGIAGALHPPSPPGRNGCLPGVTREGNGA